MQSAALIAPYIDGRFIGTFARAWRWLGGRGNLPGLDGSDARAVLGEEQLAKDSAQCAETGMVTRRHYDCAMAAQSVEALQACGAPNT